MVAPGGWGACVVAMGGVCGCYRGCVVALWGACMVAPRGTCMVAPGGAWDTTRYGDTINERVVCILLECILVKCAFQGSHSDLKNRKTWKNRKAFSSQGKVREF